MSDNVKYKYFNTSMDYLQKILSRFHFRKGREWKRDTIPFTSIIKEPPNSVRQGYYYMRRDEIVRKIRESKDRRKCLFAGYDAASNDEKEEIWVRAAEIKQECIEEIEALSTTPGTMYLVLKDLDSPETSDIARYMLEVLFGRPNTAFFDMLEASKENIYTLVESEAGDVNYFGFTFERALLGSNFDEKCG